MKGFSALEVHYMAAELRQLVGARLDQVYCPGKKEFFFQFHLRGRGRAVLKVRVPSFLHLSQAKETGESVSGFCAFLRKRLKNSTLKAIRQPGFERILELEFSSKNGLFSLFLEFFSKGNVILVNEGKIAAAGEKQAWSTRTISPGQPYSLPPPVAGLHSLGEKALLGMLQATTKSDLVRFLAIELSLGGLYAEEACLRSGINKETKPAAITASAAKNLLRELKKLLSSKPSPSVIYKGNKPVDAVPIDLCYYEGCEKKPKDSFSSAIEEFNSLTAQSFSSYDSEISRLQHILEQQRQTIAESAHAESLLRKKGELVYEHYPLFKEILDAFMSGGWHALKELRKQGKIKSLDEKSGNITVDVSVP